MSMLQRGNIAMGFDQNKIRHNFIPTASGGEIVITSLNGNDTTTINQIRDTSRGFKMIFQMVTLQNPFSYMPSE